MNNYTKVLAVAAILIANGIFAAIMSKSIREGNTAWYWTYITSIISASIYAYQLKAKIMPLTVMSVFQTFFFHSAWYATAFFILNNELQGHKLIGLILAFAGMIIMSI
jgi:multidrug transporter EmrE-like cation transporter